MYADASDIRTYTKHCISFICRQLTIEIHSQSSHCVRSELDNTANVVSDDVINQPALTSLSEIDNLKSNEAYTMVMTCSTNPSYTVVEPAREEFCSK